MRSKLVTLSSFLRTHHIRFETPMTHRIWCVFWRNPPLRVSMCQWLAKSSQVSENESPRRHAHVG